jgi:hypothetical protein
MVRKLLVAALGLLVLAAGASSQTMAQTAAQSHFGRAERRDPIFLRFPEMAQRYWENTETMAASHKSVAVPMPRQCAFLYADTYTRNQMSEREVQQMALSNCNAKLSQLGSLGDNYGVPCRCQVIISDGAYVVPRESLPDQAYGPASIFYRDDRGNVARLNGTARYGALLGHDRSVTFALENARAEPVCEGTFTNDGPRSGRFSLNCFNGQFAGNGTYESHTGNPNDHILARGSTGRGQPIVIVIGLPAQLATTMYGGL